MKSLELDEAVPLGYALVAAVAQSSGISALAIKGPVGVAFGLREAGTSVDVDFLVAPEHRDDLVERLGALGWHSVVPAGGVRILESHSVTLEHDFWPCQLDMHQYFPGLLAEPSASFHALWSRRQTLIIAGKEVPATDRIGTIALAALHLLRDEVFTKDRFALLCSRVEESTGPKDWRDLADFARVSGAASTLAPLFERLQIPIEDDDSTDDARLRWRYRTALGAVRAAPAIVNLLEAPSRDRPQVLRRLLWPSEEQLRAARPGLGPASRHVILARLTRLTVATVTVPRAALKVMLEKWRYRRAIDRRR